MAEHIECHKCDSPYCDGCNIYILAKMLRRGKLDRLMDEHHSVQFVEAETVKHGRWECEHETWGKLQCSVCKKEALLEKANGDIGTILLYVTSNYCPNCGAKMDWNKKKGKLI